MKTLNKIITLLLATASTLGMSACNDFLDVPPTTNVSIPATIQEFRDMLYPQSPQWSQDPIIVYMGDDIYLTKYYYDNKPQDFAQRRAYLWDERVYDISFVPTYWNNSYNRIYTYNKIIDEVGSVEGESEAELAQIECEARVYRAMQYFHLACLYTKPYPLATESDPGIPLQVKNDVTVTEFSRSTVFEVYRYILDDLDAAIEVLPPYPYRQSRFIASGTGARGLKARVLFLMGNYSDALETLEELLTILDNETPPFDAYHLFDFNTLKWRIEDQPWMGPDYSAGFPASFYGLNPECILGSTYMMDPTNGGVVSLLVSDYQQGFYTDAGDLREEYYFLDRQMYSGAPIDPDVPGVKMKAFSYSSIGASLPDVYLMAAECYARGGDISNALKYLNALRENRFRTDSYTALSSTDARQILGWVLEERIREFIATGHRWLDMRRLWNDPVGGPMINKTRVLDGTTYTLTENRLTLRIPDYIMQYHNDWVQNP